jgi:hypothetical protein
MLLCRIKGQGATVIQRGCEILEALADFVVDEDDDEPVESWGQAMYTRQGLLQDLGVFDLVVDMLRCPIEGIKEDAFREEMFPEFVRAIRPVYKKIF